MTTKEFIKLHEDEIKEIPTEKILLIEKIHMNGHFSPTDRSDDELAVVVRPLEETDSYALVMGWADYKEARERKLPTIKCIITDDRRGYFIRKNLWDYADIDTINIRKSYAEHPPKEYKIQQKMNYYNTHGVFKESITVNSRDTLTDGYATYIAAKRLGLDKVPVRKFV